MMGGTATTKLAIAISFFVLATTEAESLERAPQFVRHTFVEAGFFTGFYAMSTQWVSLQASSDLITWTNLIHFSTGRTNPIPFVDETAGEAEHRFYRVRSPGMSVDQAQELWHAQGLQDYRYRIEATWHELVENAEERGPSSISSLPPELPEVRKISASGLVTVRDGIRTISEAELFYDSEPLPPEEITPEDFPTFDDIYRWLGRASQSGALRLRARYHRGLGFPVVAQNLYDREGFFDYNALDFETLPELEN